MEREIIMERSANILYTYPLINETQTDALLAREIQADPTKLIVLDDDPTGVQTVHNVSVYTDWKVESIRQGLLEPGKLFFILTNSRGMTASETTRIHKEIIANISTAAKETGIPYLIISRSDSTLRGHYPLETLLLKEGAETEGKIVDGEILCPFFKEGGRFTIDNIHYVKYGDTLVPAAETEFAKDRTFGYSHSSIPEYVEEKTKGAYKKEDVICISLEDLRTCAYDKILEQLMTCSGFQKICVNAVDYCDLKVFGVAFYRALAKGKNFMLRTAAGLVKVLGGISDRPLLTAEDMIQHESRERGGIVVVGSHTKKTTEQLAELLKLPNVVPIEFHSDLVLETPEVFQAEIDRCVQLEEQCILEGKTAVCYTNRTLLQIKDDTAESALLRSVRISDGVQNLVGRLHVTPAFVLAKGGITSSDVGTKALQVHKATVLGQIRPGIPVWQTGPESRFPQIPYIIFPGNVGTAETLREAVEILTENKNVLCTSPQLQ